MVIIYFAIGFIIFIGKIETLNGKDIFRRNIVNNNMRKILFLSSVLTFSFAGDIQG